MSLNKDLHQGLNIVEVEQYSEEQEKNPETVIELKGPRNDHELPA